MNGSNKDRIYADKLENIRNFVFDENVAQVFEDMIERSVPGYEVLNKLLPIIANYFIKPNTNCYDLGCSLGEASISVAKNIKQKNVKIYAVDNSYAMIEKLSHKLSRLNYTEEVKIIYSDIFEQKITDATFIILNYTMQFIEIERREQLLEKIYSGLNDGGAVLVSEKIKCSDLSENKIIESLHEKFKQMNSYSKLEISQKREALENVLIRDTHETHMTRFHKAGFSNIYIVCKFLNFVSYLAIK